MLKVDLHLHSSYSRDCLTSLETIIVACRRRGLGAIAVTDHNTIAGALALREIAPFPVIVGEEINTSRGEMLAYFLEEEIPPGLSPQETIACIREQGGVVGVSHPFDRLRQEAMREEALMEIIDQVDALEVFNSRIFFPDDNLQAEKLAYERGILCTAGSDAHTSFEIGRAWMEMPTFDAKDKESFLAALAQGRVCGRLSPPWVHFVTSLVKLYIRVSRIAYRKPLDTR